MEYLSDSNKNIDRFNLNKLTNLTKKKTGINKNIIDDTIHDNEFNIDKLSNKKKHKILEISSNIIEKTICKEDFNLDIFPLYSNISNILEINEKEDTIFFIDKNKNLNFGISEKKINNFDYFHIDPKNWKKLTKKFKNSRIYLTYIDNNTNKIIKFRNTNCLEEINRINKIFIN